MDDELPIKPKFTYLADRRWIVSITLFLFFAESAYGFYQGLILQVLPADAISRVANAYYVVAVQPPRLSSIGLIWNPLPSLLELPLVALASLWKPIVSRGLASCLVTAAFSALSACILLSTFLKFQISKAYTLFFTLLYVLHPYIFYYGSNGMSESIFFFFIIYCICNLTLWHTYGSGSYLTKIAFGLPGGFLVRYETIPFAVGIGICIVLNILFNPGEKSFWAAGGRRFEQFRYMEGTLVMLYTPAVYTALVWVLICWIITGNPLYFFNSNYSNMAQSESAVQVSTIPELIQYVSFRAMPFLLVLFAMIAMRIIGRAVFRYDFLCLVCLVLSLLLFHILMYWTGSSFGWLRFFCYSLPVCAAFLPYESAACRDGYFRPGRAGRHYAGGREKHHDRAPVSQKLFGVLLSAALVVSVILLNNVMQGRKIPDYEGSTHDEEYRIADYINEKLPDRTILTDVFTTYNIALNVDHFQNLVVSSSMNFKACVADPVGNGVEYVLIPDPKDAPSDALNLAYPNLYEQGTDWCVEAREFSGYKLFQVTG